MLRIHRQPHLTKPAAPCQEQIITLSQQIQVQIRSHHRPFRRKLPHVIPRQRRHRNHFPSISCAHKLFHLIAICRQKQHRLRIPRQYLVDFRTVSFHNRRIHSKIPRVFPIRRLPATSHMQTQNRPLFEQLQKRSQITHHVITWLKQTLRTNPVPISLPHPRRRRIPADLLQFLLRRFQIKRPMEKRIQRGDRDRPGKLLV